MRIVDFVLYLIGKSKPPLLSKKLLRHIREEGGATLINHNGTLHLVTEGWAVACLTPSMTCPKFDPSAIEMFAKACPGYIGVWWDFENNCWFVSASLVFHNLDNALLHGASTGQRYIYSVHSKALIKNRSN